MENNNAQKQKILPFITGKKINRWSIAVPIIF